MVVEHAIEWNDEKVSRLWNYYSRACPVPYFSELHGGVLLKQTGLPLSEPLGVLDFGCGPGFIWDHLRRLGSTWTYTGIDFSKDSVAKLEAKANGHRNFEGSSSISGLPSALPSENFDVVLLIEVVEHLDDEKLIATLTEAARVLKRGGVLVVSTPNDEDLSKSVKFCPDCGSIFHEWQHLRNWTQLSLAQYVETFGFRLKMVRALDFGLTSMVGRTFTFIRHVLGKSRPEPHMLALFVKA